MEDDNEQVKSFKDMGICKPLVEACENFGWKTPSYFQANFILHALKGKDLFGRAEASSHNVGAFALPILQAFFEAPQNFSACVISPTRERAREIVELFKALGSCIGIKCEMGKWTDIQHARELPDIVGKWTDIQHARELPDIVGKWADMQHGIDFQELPDIVVWAVEDFFHHLISTGGSCLPTVKYLVVDKTDMLLEKHSVEEIDTILKVVPRERRTYILSAYMDKEVRKLAGRLHDFRLVQEAFRLETDRTVKLQRCLVFLQLKGCHLVNILTKNSGSTSIVFAGRPDTARLLVSILQKCILKALLFCGSMARSQKVEALRKFKERECDILVQSLMSCRGFSLPIVDMVVNYETPSYPQDFVLNAAQARQSGLVITLVDQHCNEEMKRLDIVEAFTGRRIEEFQSKSVEAMKFFDKVREVHNLYSEAKKKYKEGVKKRGRDEDLVDEEFRHVVLMTFIPQLVE